MWNPERNVENPRKTYMYINDQSDELRRLSHDRLSVVSKYGTLVLEILIQTFAWKSLFAGTTDVWPYSCHTYLMIKIKLFYANRFYLWRCNIFYRFLVYFLSYNNLRPISTINNMLAYKFSKTFHPVKIEVSHEPSPLKAQLLVNIGKNFGNLALVISIG